MMIDDDRTSAASGGGHGLRQFAWLHGGQVGLQHNEVDHSALGSDIGGRCTQRRIEGFFRARCCAVRSGAVGSWIGVDRHADGICKCGNGGVWGDHCDAVDGRDGCDCGEGVVKHGQHQVCTRIRVEFAREAGLGRSQGLDGHYRMHGAFDLRARMRCLHDVWVRGFRAVHPSILPVITLGVRGCPPQCTTGDTLCRRFFWRRPASPGRRGERVSKAAVLGAGSWGTALAKVMAEAGTDVTMWARREEVAKRIDTTHENSDYLPGIALPSSIRATHHHEEAMAGADFIVLAVPSQSLRGNLEQWKGSIGPDATLLSLAKGIETGTLMRMSQVIVSVTGVEPGRVAVLSGPNLAHEIASGQPAATVIACSDSSRALALQDACATGYFRPYTNSDVIGCEIGGACKNVIALACGMAAGSGFGDNTVASIITRGLAETIRLGVALGAKASTLAGLAGVGDLVATCTSELSRNRTFGERLGRGGSMESAQKATNGQVAEGVKSCTSVRALAAGYDVEMPLTDAVHRVCHEGMAVSDAIGQLLGRRTKPE